MPVHCHIADHVARVTIDRPEVLNALDAAAEAELQAIWRRLEEDRAVRAIVLTGAGDRAFSAGADMKSGTSKSGTSGADGSGEAARDGAGAGGLAYWAEARPGGFGGIALRETIEVPVIARINGHALGGGFEMVLGCDIAIAVAEATFGLPEARVGRLPLDGGMALLQRQIPYRHAMGLLLTGRRISADEALAMGILNEVVPRGDLDRAVDRWLADILACAPLSVRAIKQVVRRTAHLTASEAQAQRLPALIAALRSDDSEEGVRAFIARRKPVWKGK
jgi:crotonobetainyl-CoA hydratase